MASTRKVVGGMPVHFSGHETFPLRQMWLKKAYEQTVAGGFIPKSTFSAENAIASFGVGKNMVASIRHWALACGVMHEADDGFRIGSLATEILQDGGLDPYAESPSTAWLAHWQLAGRCFRSTTWHWLFNHVTAPTFTRQELEEPLARYARELDPKHRLSASTISRDLETCLRSYAPRVAGGSPEDFAEPLLGELGLLQEVHKGQYAFRRGPKASLHDGVFAYAVVDFWNRQAGGQSSLAFETVAYAEGSPGRVFKLDEESIAQRLISLSDFTGRKLAWTDSAGLRQVHRKEMSKEDIKNMIRRAYDWAVSRPKCNTGIRRSKSVSFTGTKSERSRADDKARKSRQTKLGIEATKLGQLRLLMWTLVPSSRARSLDEALHPDR